MPKKRVRPSPPVDKWYWDRAVVKWDPEDPVLYSDIAPHEVNGILRFRSHSGLRSAQVAEVLGIPTATVMEHVRRGFGELRIARMRNQPLHYEGVRNEL